MWYLGEMDNLILILLWLKNNKTWHPYLLRASFQKNLRNTDIEGFPKETISNSILHSKILKILQRGNILKSFWQKDATQAWKLILKTYKILLRRAIMTQMGQLKYNSNHNYNNLSKAVFILSNYLNNRELFFSKHSKRVRLKKKCKDNHWYFYQLLQKSTVLIKLDFCFQIN
jgi:hypothetical protein